MRFSVTNVLAVASLGSIIGSVVGTGVGSSLVLLRRLGVLARKAPPSTFSRTILRSAGVGAVIGTLVMAVAVPSRMWGREEMEWQDRSWRLLENRGQLELDDWTYGGMTGGLVAALAKRRGSGWIGAVGKVGLGSVGGLVGYMAWRYGLNGGKFEGEGTLRAKE